MNTDGESRAMALLSGWQKLAAESMLVVRSRVAKALGATFGGNRKVYDELGYPQSITLEMYRERYERGGVAETLIEAMPTSTWSGGANIREVSEDDEQGRNPTAFERSVKQLFRKHKLWSVLRKADILAGLGHYGVIVIGAPGKFESPLPRGLNIDQIAYFQPYAEENASIDSYQENRYHRRFGRPQVYTIRVGEEQSKLREGTARAQDSIKVHWSRIIHVAEGNLSDPSIGKPVLRSVWNYLEDLDKLIGGGSEAAWKRMDPGVQFDIDPEIEADEAEEQAFSEELDEFQHGFRRYLRTRGVKMNVLTSGVAQFGSNVDTVIKMLAATKRYPLRILTGTERGELASSQDRATWNERVSARRENHADDILDDLIQRGLDHGFVEALSSDMGFQTVWRDIEELDETEKATVLNKIAQANKAQVDAGRYPFLLEDEVRRAVYDMLPYSADQLSEMEEQQLARLRAQRRNSSPFGSDDDGGSDEGDDEE